MKNKKIQPIAILAVFVSILFLNAYSQIATLTSPMEELKESILIPAENFFNTSNIKQLRVSGDGNWLAFIKDYQGAPNVYLMAIGSNVEDAQPITKAMEPISNFVWSIDNNDIFFIKDSGGNENSQIFRITFDFSTPKITSNIDQLTRDNDIRYMLIGQSKASPKKLIVMANQDNPKSVDVYHLDIESKVITNVFENSYSFSQMGFNRQGEPVLGRSTNPDNTSELYGKINDQWSRLIKTEVGESIRILSYDESKKFAYISANIEGRDKQELLRLDMNDGNLKTLHKDPKSKSDVKDVLFNNEGAPLAVSYYGGYLRTYSLDNTFKTHWQNINKHFKQNVEITVIDHNEKTGSWQLHVASDVDMGSDYKYDANTGEVRLLHKQTPSIDPELLSKRQSITYKSQDGVDIQAYLTLPKGLQKNIPTIILPHGGPWARDYWTLNSGYFNSIAQLLANRGYAVLQPNYRSSKGFGKRFLNLGNNNWGIGTMQNDLTDGVEYLISKSIADKQRIGIMGGSYGGYAALSGATFTPELYQAVISFCGPSSLITLMESFPALWRPYLGQWFNAVGDPEIESDRIDMQSRSPLNYVDQIKTPLMLIQGANDPRVTQAESDNIAKLMYQKSLPVEYILAEDEGHGFHKRINKLASVVAIERFFGKHLGGRIDKNVPQYLETHLDKLKVDVKQL